MADNLTLPQVAPNQDQKEVTINDAFTQLSGALDDFLAVSMSGGDVTITSTQFTSNMGFVASGASATHIMTFPAIKRALFYVENDNTASLTVKVGSTTFSLAVDAFGFFQTDGTANGLEQVSPQTLATLLDVLVTSPTNNQILTYNTSSGKWINQNAPYDIGISFSGAPGASQTVNIDVVRAFQLPVGLTGSKFSIGVNPTATMTFTLQKNGSNIGTIAFSTGGVPTVTFTTLTSFAAGDVFSIVAPASPDATGANIGMTYLTTLL